MKRNLLFISRYPEIIDEFQGILEEKQIETEIAQNGTDAMELLKQKEYQILVTDLNLDGYNGDKILSYVNQKFPDTICMLYTNSISAVQLGFYLNKRDVFRVFLRPVNFRQEFMQALEEAYELYDLKKHDRDSRQERLKQLEDNRKAIAEIEGSDGLERLNEVRQAVLGKKGELTAVLKGMKDVAPEDRPKVGQWVNDTRSAIETVLEEKMKILEADALKKRYEAEKIDVTMPAVKHEKGNLHPVTQVRNQLIDIFASMGFEVYEGAEIETDYYNFTALNTPQDHPARDMQDTFYLSPEFLLRTQTSAGQIHVMEAKKPPIKVISPGKVFRSDDDATHSPMFTQMEGLVVDKGITLCDLKGMLDELVKKIFGKETTTRLRPSYFPFTEPSVEVDVSCFQCGGCGCKLCKGTGWIEVLGAGVVNNKVLEGCGIDTNEYSGFAFGIGIERIAMLKYGINNIKLLFESDMRVLKQIDD